MTFIADSETRKEPMRLPLELSGDFHTELQSLLAEHGFRAVVIWFRGPQQRGFACTRPISDNGAWISRQYRLVPLLDDFREDGFEVLLEFVPGWETITWGLHQEKYPVPSPTATPEPILDLPSVEKAIRPKDEVSEQNAPSVFNDLQAQKVFGNPEIDGCQPEARSEVSIGELDPSVVIKQNRGGRPRKWASDAERMAFKRALKAKKPVTVQTLVADLEKPPSRSVSASLLQRRVQEQRGKCLLCERAFGTFVTNRERTERLRPSADHFEPFSLQRNNDAENIFAVDQICNSMKRDWIFRGLDEARAWMSNKWNEEGWRDGFSFQPFRADLSLCSPN